MRGRGLTQTLRCSGEAVRAGRVSAMTRQEPSGGGDDAGEVQVFFEAGDELGGGELGLLGRAEGVLPLGGRHAREDGREALGEGEDLVGVLGVEVDDLGGLEQACCSNRQTSWASAVRASGSCQASRVR
ncbi:hypothetical protein GCM10020000_05840 [Streptomyces olivoverticillatus]